jgi:hypothetical protein
MRPAYGARRPKSVTKSTVGTWKKSGPLRLEHIRFFYLKDDGGIAVRVAFRHPKGKSGPDLSSQDNTRQYTLVPSPSHQPHLDIVGLLFSLTYSYGYFMESIEDVLSASATAIATRPIATRPIATRPIATCAHLNTQPVFFDCFQVESASGKPLRSKTLHRELKRMCIDAGLVGAFTSYMIRMAKRHHHGAHSTPWTSKPRRVRWTSSR